MIPAHWTVDSADNRLWPLLLSSPYRVPYLQPVGLSQGAPGFLGVVMAFGTVTGTFTSLWSAAVQDHRDRTFLLFRDVDGTVTSWTYGDFDDLVGRTAAQLVTLGVERGQPVHLCLRNCPAFLLIWLAVTRIGAWMVPVDPASTGRDIDNQVGRTHPVVGICSADRAEVYRSGVTGRIEHIIELTETARDTEPGSPLLSPDPPSDPDPGQVEPEDRLAIMFTSGTTSEPKGVVLTQANYWSVATTMSGLAKLTEDSRWYVCLPLFHGNAQYYCFAPAIHVGGSVALTARFTASRWPHEAAELEATHASLFAAPIRMILARRREDAPALALRHVWFAQSLGEEHYRQFSRMCGVAPRQLYGMTETMAIVTADLRETPGPDSIGQVVPGRRVRLLAKGTARDVPEGDPGVITLLGERGGDIFDGYLDNPDANGVAFPEIEEGRAWFSTGDLARVRPDGQLVFVGRIDDVIKVSGENVSLTEVEAALAQAPGVLEVAVLAADDPIRDKVPIAFVVPRHAERPPSLDELTEWSTQHLPPQSRPRRWTIIDQLPRTSVGKIRRFKLSDPSAAPSQGDAGLPTGADTEEAT